MKYYYLSKLRSKSDSAYHSIRESLGIPATKFSVPYDQSERFLHRALIVEGDEPKDLIEYEKKVL